MDPSLLIAGYGAVLSSVLALPTLHRWRTDRPRLRVELSYEGTYEKLPGYEHVQEFPDDLQGVQLIANVKVDVWNDGRVDATVRDVALAFSVDHGEITALQPLYEPGEVVAIPAVNVRRFTIDHFDLQPPVPVDKPLRAYVVDGQGRIIWSRPVRLYRLLVASGWRAPETIPPEQLDHQDLPPDLPEPMWKLWKPRHLRRGNDVDTGVR